MIRYTIISIIMNNNVIINEIRDNVGLLFLTFENAS